MLFQIDRIDTSRQPWLFYLKDLFGVKKPGTYYEKQLKLVPLPLSVEVSTMDLFIYLSIDCLDECQEFILICKCLLFLMILSLIIKIGKDLISRM